MLFSALCFLLIYSPLVLGQCPSGFTKVSSWCYQILEPHYYFDEAQTQCASMAPGGKLVDVETREEFLALFDWMNSGKTSFYT